MEKFARRAHSYVPWVAASLLVGAMVLGCERRSETESQTGGTTEPVAEQKPEKAMPEQAKEVTRAVAKLSPTQGNDVTGTVTFEQMADGVKVTADLTGLDPNTTHGFHIHEKGDCSAPDATSAGGHYAPNGNPHGLPPDEKRHAGDMGNITSDAEGNVKFEGKFDNFSLSGEAPVVGRAVIVHINKDQGTQPTGDAGARVACGVIEAEGS